MQWSHSDSIPVDPAIFNAKMSLGSGGGVFGGVAVLFLEGHADGLTARLYCLDCTMASLYPSAVAVAELFVLFAALPLAPSLFVPGTGLWRCTRLCVAAFVAVALAWRPAVVFACHPPATGIPRKAE